ncbi:hypothetical protein [Anabaena azotica]|nr:hypothetical protein [Anabaena azotica]
MRNIVNVFCLQMEMGDLVIAIVPMTNRLHPQNAFNSIGQVSK